MIKFVLLPILQLSSLLNAGRVRHITVGKKVGPGKNDKIWDSVPLDWGDNLDALKRKVQQNKKLFPNGVILSQIHLTRKKGSPLNVYSDLVNGYDDEIMVKPSRDGEYFKGATGQKPRVDRPIDRIQQRPPIKNKSGECDGLLRFLKECAECV